MTFLEQIMLKTYINSSKSEKEKIINALGGEFSEGDREDSL